MSALDWLFAAFFLYLCAAVLCLVIGWMNRRLDDADREGGSWS